MSTDPRAPVAAITMMRGDGEFLEIWLRHYGAHFGSENLFVILDGQDQKTLPDLGCSNLICLPHIPTSREAGDRARARVVSHLARALFYHYRRVVACDVDELLCLDPNAGDSLRDYLLTQIPHASVSAMGLDLGQHPEHESALDFSRPILHQRAYAQLSARYTKPVVATLPVTWGSGFHRIKGRGLRIDPNLLLFHIGLVDKRLSESKAQRTELVDNGWSGHFQRRFALYENLQKFPARDADPLIAAARQHMLWRRPVYALNKPGRLPENMIVKIPERLRDAF